MMITPEKPIEPMTDCPSKDDLRSLSMGILSGEDSDILIQHLDDCGACQSALETLNDVEDSLIAGLRENVQADTVDSEPQRDLALAKALGSLALAHESAAVESTDNYPRSIGEYEIVRPLGSGGMGRVFLARHTKLGREVALKVIADHRLSDSSVRKRFEQEMQAIGRLSHPNIVAAHDAREIDSTAVLVTEYIDGLDLGQIAQRVGQISVADASQAIKQVAVALKYTSDQGFVHRDIKPQNVMVSRTGQVKLLDLGLARIHGDDSARTGMTGTGQTMGTADYVSPEQVTDSRDVDVRSDLYSLGCTLFKLLAGQAPFATDRHTTAFAKMNAHVSEQPPSVLQFRDDVPKPIVKLIGDMLAKDPSKRPSDPLAVARSLEPFCEGADLEALVQTAADSEYDIRPHSKPADSKTPRPTAPVVWWRRRVPVAIAIATGFSGAILGAICGILITIKSSDGKVMAQINTEKGAEISVREVDDNPADNDLSALAPEAVGKAEAFGPAIPLMLGILKTDPNVKFEANGVRVHHIATSGNKFVSVLEDSSSLWFPVSDDFESTPTQLINDEPHVAVSLDKSDLIRWSDLREHIVSVQSDAQGIQVELDRQAGEQLGSVTRKNISKSLAVIVDGVVVSSPRILTEVGNRFVISGNFDSSQRRVLIGALANSRSPLKGATLQAQMADVRAQMAKKAKTDEQARIALAQMDELMKLINANQNPPAVAPMQDVSSLVRLNLKQIGIAMHNYNTVYQKLPASAAPRFKAKKSAPAISWRVAILPFIDGQELYEEYNFDEPWDSEHNKQFLDRIPDVFKSPYPNTPVGHTHIQGLAGDDRGMGIKEAYGFRDTFDGTANTVLVAETTDSVPWTKPHDVSGFPKLRKDEIRFLMMDGRVVQVPEIESDLFKKMMTRAGGEAIELPFK